MCALVAVFASAPASASQPSIVDERPDVCASPGPGDSIVEARIVSFEQPRYDCGPDPGGVQDGWLDVLVALDPAHAPLRPTLKTGCLFGEMSAIVDHHSDPGPERIDLRVDGVVRTVSYEHSWALCGLTPGHHTVEVPTDRGTLVCANDVRANEWRALVATSRGAILHLEPLRVAAGRGRALAPVTVEYDELRLNAYQPRFEGIPPTAMLRIWTSSDGVLRAEPCLHPDRVGAHPSAASAAQPAPSRQPARGCAHCAIAGDDVSAPMTFLLLMLAVARGRRRRG